MRRTLTWDETNSPKKSHEGVENSGNEWNNEGGSPVNLRLRAATASDLTDWLKVFRMWATALKQEGHAVVWTTKG